LPIYGEIGMSNEGSRNHLIANRTDHRRIVPIKTDQRSIQLTTGVEARPAAHLVYRGNILLESVEVFTIFWGSQWSQDPNLKDLVSKINKFFEDILKSSLIDQLSQYDINGYNIGHGTLKGTVNISNPQPGNTVTGGLIENVLANEIATNNNFPQPSDNTLYFIYTPPGAFVSALGSGSCISGGFCGYHDNIPGTKIYYAVMPYPSCGGCTSFGELDTFQAITQISSHELCEAITDPIPGKGWYDGHHGEIGDICEGGNKDIDGYTVQQEWSNKDKKCI